MNKYNNLYCKVFLDTDINREQLLPLIAKLINGKVSRREIETSIAKISVRTNDDFDENQREEFPDGFLYYRFFLDIEPLKDTDQKVYIETLSHFLESLWSLNYKVVAACDFEEELPRKGGYNWL
ncbi:hypothetical protein [Crocosphaera chwakensis]|uniref:Naphthoate synthase n=1 Tax=Crocosphaera chwakensis CCY0110 TaxID=391612 RepID=A3IKP5_9CHRO|nr:hypothetical protein [Crocosphaera chwakensis]EAZ92764.1 naphthoate synthase [Crocosphaera chwakensis CCY0110]